MSCGKVRVVSDLAPQHFLSARCYWLWSNSLELFSCKWIQSWQFWVYYLDR